MYASLLQITNREREGEVDTEREFQFYKILATDSEVPSSIPGLTKFSEKYGVWNGVHSSS
jgi:hypothetical protein